MQLRRRILLDRFMILQIAVLILIVIAIRTWRAQDRPALAQTSVPPQFEKLHTDANDYTCGGAVPCASWPMPPLPAVGASWDDAAFGTTTWTFRETGNFRE